jgi:hypothetical protein
MRCFISHSHGSRAVAALIISQLAGEDWGDIFRDGLPPIRVKNRTEMSRTEMAHLAAKSGRLADPDADQIRASDQPQDRQGTRPQRSADAVGLCRPSEQPGH